MDLAHLDRGDMEVQDALTPVLHAASVSAQTRSSTCAMVSAGCAPEIPYRRSMTKKGTPVTPSEWATSSSAWTA